MIYKVIGCCSVALWPNRWQHTRLPSRSGSRRLHKFVSIESVMPSDHLIFYCPLLLLPSSFPASGSFPMRVFRIRWPKYWSFSFRISPSKEYSGLISLELTGFISLLSKELSRVFSHTTVQEQQFFGAQLSL